MPKLVPMSTHPVALMISGSVAAGSYFLTEQAATPATNWLGYVPLISAAISLLTSIAVLKFWIARIDQTQEQFRREMREDLRDITTLIRDTSERVARLEG